MTRQLVLLFCLVLMCSCVQYYCRMTLGITIAVQAKREMYICSFFCGCILRPEAPARVTLLTTHTYATLLLARALAGSSLTPALRFRMRSKSRLGRRSLRTTLPPKKSSP